MKAGPGSKASPKSRQRNKRVHKTIIFFLPCKPTRSRILLRFITMSMVLAPFTLSEIWHGTGKIPSANKHV